MKFDDLYIDEPQNISNLHELIDSFSKESYVPFIGAGTSIPLGEMGWSKLYKNMRDSLGVAGVRKVFNDDKIDYPRSFLMLFRKTSDPERFYEQLFNHLDPKFSSLHAFHLKLVDLFDSYITTNYDSPIEEAYENQRKKSLKKHYFSSYGLNNFAESIVYLHGHKDINFCIIKSDDYDYFYPSVSKSSGIPILEDFLKEVFTKRSVIFAGFSFNDKYIEDFLYALHSRQSFRYTHYWLIHESSNYFEVLRQKVEKLKEDDEIAEAEEEVNKFYQGKMNIKPIVYKHDFHIFAQKLFERLLETKPVDIKSGKIGATPVR